MSVYYNEHDPAAAAWLRELIKAELIAPGDVDETDIQKIRSKDLASYTQVHLFAGIGGWSHALRLAGWPDDRRVWTGSCPCQPFSAAGKQKGRKDARHLWPWMRHLMFLWRPAIAFGEQVASALGREWLAGVRANLETLEYVVGAADLCAAGIAAPHIRQRLFWVADASPRRLRINGSASRSTGHADELCEAGRMGESVKQGLEGHAGHVPNGDQSRRIGSGSDGPTAAASGFGEPWSRFDILPFEDGKIRRVECGTFPLADGVPGRMGLLRGYGNAIVPQLAATFITAYEDSLNRQALGYEHAHKQP